MFRAVTDDLYWVQECVNASDLDTLKGDPSALPNWYKEGCEVHGANNGYLFNGEESLLFDTGSPEAEAEFLNDVDTILGEDSLDYVAISHHELPHAGNVDSLLERYPDAQLIAPSRGVLHDLHALEDAQLVDPGETLDLGGYTIEFIEPKLYDTAIHTWLYEHTTDTLCTVDWLALPHLDSECLDYTHEIDAIEDRMVMGNGATLPWLEFVDPDKTDAAIEELLADYQPSILGPAHGLVTVENATEFLRESKRIVDEIIEAGATEIVRGA